MGISSFITKNIISKITLPIIGIGILFGSFSYTNQASTSDDNASSEAKEIILPEGGTEKEKFLNSIEETEGIEGVLNLSVSFKDKGEDSTYSSFVIDNGSFNFAKVGDTKALDLDVTLDYNGLAKDLNVHYSDDVAYFNIDSLKYKYSDSTYKSVISKLISIFGIDVLRVPDSIYDFFDSLIGEDATKYETSYIEENSDSAYGYKLSLSDNIVIHFEEDENFDLVKIHADTLTINNATLSFEIKTTRNDNELTLIRNKIPTDSSSYVETYDSLDLLRKINNIVSTERFGIVLDGTLHHEVSETNHHSSSSEDINMSINFFGDLKKMDFNGDIAAIPSSGSENKNNIFFVSQKEGEEQNTYLNYNDVMMVGMSATTFNDFLARVKDDFGTGLDIIDKILSLFDETFISNIKKGRYEDVISSLKSLSNDGRYIRMVINMGVFGLGSEGEISLKIDTSNNDEFVEMTINGVGLSGFFFNDTTVKFIEYEKKGIDASEYHFLEKIPTIYSQIYDIYSSPKFNLKIDGSLLDSHQAGLTSIKGEANLLGHNGEDALYEFDEGYVDLTLVQQVRVDDSEGNFSKLGKSKTHRISLDLEGTDMAYFQYYDPDRLKNDSSKTGTLGKIEIKPFQDVIDIIKEIYNSKDERFAKWFKVIADAEASNVIEALKTGQYSPLLSKNLVVSSSFETDTSKITLSGEAFGLYENGVAKNFSISLTHEGSEVQSLSIENLFFNDKTLNLTLTLGKCKESETTLLDHSKITTDYTGFSTLISDLYSTSNLKTFHLTAENLGISLSLGSWDMISIKLDMDFRIFVDGSIVKVYGIINTPCNSAFLIGHSNKQYSTLTRGYRTCVFYYDDIDPDTGEAYEDNSGYVYMTYNVGKEKNQISGGKYEGAYKYHSSYFQDTENLMHFIFEDIIDLKTDLYEQIVSAITKEDTSEEAINYEELITKFTYDETNRKWNIGVAIDVLLKDNTIKDLELTLASSKSSANSCYVASSLELSANILSSIIKLKGTITNTDLDQANNWSVVNETYQTYIDAHRNDQTTY